MMLDVERVVVLQIVMESLSKGVDPTSNIAFPNDTILNSNVLKACFKEASTILNFIEENIDSINNMPLRKVTNTKLPFSIRDDELNLIPLSDLPIPISRFVFFINDSYKRKNMKKLRATQITSWLTNHGYLEEIECNDGYFCKSATEQGNSIGITSVTKMNSRCEKYITNLYNKNAQRFILSNVISQLDC